MVEFCLNGPSGFTWGVTVGEGGPCWVKARNELLGMEMGFVHPSLSVLLMLMGDTPLILQRGLWKSGPMMGAPHPSVGLSKVRRFSLSIDYSSILREKKKSHLHF